MKKTSINFIYFNLWALTTGLLQGLTVMQQRVHHMKFRNVCEVKRRLVIIIRGCFFQVPCLFQHIFRLICIP